MVGRNGFLASLIVRLVPSAPFIVVNMAAGVTPMRLRDFAARNRRIGIDAAVARPPRPHPRGHQRLGHGGGQQSHQQSDGGVVLSNSSNSVVKTSDLRYKVDTVQRDTPKVGRNDPCPCGSGKKYKKCHGA